MKKTAFFVFLTVTCCLAMLLTGCKKRDADSDFSQAAVELNTADALQFSLPDESALCAVFITEKGEFAAVLYPDYAPQAVENFVTLAREGAYNGLAFHRVIQDFIIQSGDTDGSGGKSIWRNTFGVESSNLLHHYTGALCMAGGTQNGSQFYVVSTEKDSVSQVLCDQMEQLGWSREVIDAYKKVGGAPYLDNNYTVFGQVFYGMDAVYGIEATAPKSGDTPADPVGLGSVRITTYGQWKQANPDAKPNFNGA